MSNDNLQQKCEALQHSLTQALDECDELRAELESLKANVADLQSDLDTARNDLTVADAAIEEAESHLVNIASRLGVPYDPAIDKSYPIDKVCSSIGYILQGKERIMAVMETEIESLAQLEDMISELKACRREYLGQIQILQEKLTRADSDRLSELTSIMRMVQACGSVPIQNWSGALRLIERVIYAQIYKLDPSQSL